MKRWFNTVSFVTAFLFITCPVRAAAATTDVAKLSDFAIYLERGIKALTALAGVGLFVGLLAAGFTFIFAGGDAKKLEKARNSITFAIIGIVVIASAFLIISTIASFTGAKGILDLKFGI